MPVPVRRPHLPEIPRERHPAGFGHRILPAAAEVILAVGLATLVVALLKGSAPPAGLGVIYLLAVLEVAIRRGQRAALIASLLGVLTLNYLFVAPTGRLAIAHRQDLIELIAFLIAALVVGRLAAREQLRSAEADSRARLARNREREAELLAGAASALLTGGDLSGQLTALQDLIAASTGAREAALVPEGGEPPEWNGETVRLPALPPVTLWTHGSEWEHEQLSRIARPLGKLIDVARARQRTADQAAEIEAAKRAEVARTAVLHAISHDLRSPLTAITTAGSALATGHGSVQERSELVDAINGEAARLARLIDDLLDLSQIEAGAVRPRADWCDLHDIVASATLTLRTDHPIEFALPGDLPLVRADAAQLGRVFANLIENAAKFSPGDTPVRVQGTVAGGRVTVRVVDRGAGIPLAERGRVFEPFFRGRTGAGVGSGLGLAICRGFVEANGGRIVLQADTGQGTSFAVSFPVVSQPETVGPPAG